jgi:hydrogenase/urease accessory protein HupE
MLGLLPSRVSAHPFLQDSWWVLVETNRLVMRVSATLREVAIAQNLGADATNGTPRLERFQQALEKHGPYLLRSLQLKADGQPLAGEVLDWQLVTDTGVVATQAPSPQATAPGGTDPAVYLDQTHAAFDLEFKFPAGHQPHEITFGQATLKEFNYAPGMAWDVTYALSVKDADRKDMAAGIVRTDLPFTLKLTPSGSTNAPTSTTPQPARSPALDAAPVRVPFLSYLRLGVHHILTGYDHLLFLAALALAARKATDFLKLIAVFTAAHSITVTASAMNWVRLPSWFVEPFIAATIVFVAVENLLAPARAGTRARLLLAFGFGLVHGLGFAGGLNEALGGVGGTALARAIVAFCLGVECGHLLVGVPFWSVLRAGRAEWGDRFARQSLSIGSILVALGGLYFLIAALRQYS